MAEHIKVLITGASGFIGSHIIEALQFAGIEVVAIGRRHLAYSVRQVRVDLLAGDNIMEILREERPTHLIHLAWETKHDTYWTSPTNLCWVDASIRLVDAFCVAGGRKVLMAGTCAEYDWSHGYFNEETTPLKPSSLYGIAKDATRRLIEAVCDQYQVPFCWGRIFLPFGRGEAPTRLIPSLIEFFEGKREPFPINTAVYRDFLHATDLAAGFIQLLVSESQGIYNICSGEPTQLHDVVSTIAELLNGDPEPILALSTERIGEPAMLVGNSSKLKKLGWKSMLKMPQSLEVTLRCQNS